MSHNNKSRNFIIVAPPNKESFEFGFSFGHANEQHHLRKMAIDVSMIQVSYVDKNLLLDQFVNLPEPIAADEGPITYYGDMAKFVCRHLNLLFKPEE